MFTHFRHRYFHLRRSAGALALVWAFAALGVAAAVAAVEPKVENPHGKFKADCALCHGAAGWKPEKISPQFNHASYGFPLSGAHSAAKCMACHASLDFTDSKRLCASCHQDPHRGEMGSDCARCHSARSFIDRTAMVHQHQQTSFPLTGSHAQIDCEQCHKPSAQGQMQFVGTKAECQACHINDYQAAKNPDHVAGGFPLDCTSCHSTLTWTTKTFDHDKTGFPLTGAHRVVACNQCHGDGVYKGKTTDCYGCHKVDYNATTNPAHAAAGFPTACSTCHTTVSWTTATFDHNTQTAFPLTGAHTSVQCSSCHGDGVFKGKSMLCASCHTTDYNGTTDPKHAASGFATTCDQCHTTVVWTGVTFDHTANTTFPLTGGHIGLDCNQCHSSGVYKGLSTLCYSCHQTDYAGTTNPAHQAGGFPTACETCHGTTNWTSSTFNHNTSTTFPLTGAHVAVACNGCHSSGVYKGLSTLCNSCHATDYSGTTDPKHSAAAATFVTTCESCHTTIVWTGVAFDHTANTTFPLTGAHIGLDCNSCHSSNVFKGLNTLCYSCHTADYNGTTNPPHQASGMPTTCDQCHTTTTWGTGTFNHNTSTTFPLTGAHVAVACSGCHSSGVYKGLSTLCYSCHASSYQTTVLNHTAAAFATTCENCHTTTAWNPGTFNHTTGTTYPLTGAHQAVACSGCHSTVFKGLSTLCYSCHTADYTGTTDPKHGAAAFATTCDNCHTTTAWTGATFDHTANTTFPLTGGHVGLDCNQCHSSGVYKGLSTLCYSCHQTDYAGTTNPAHQAGGFPTTCETCHSTTNWTSSTFNHNTSTTFPLTGGHVGLDCNQCHSSGVYKGLSTLCYSCHTTEFQTTVLNHTAAGFATTCENCHTTTAWNPGTFNHTTGTTFPLTGAHIPLLCNQCHTTVFKGLSTLCYSCHQTDYNGTTQPPHAASSFPTTCDQCHTTTDWGSGTFNHNTNTTFPLTGAHIAVACSGCHSSGVYKGLSTLCYSCHASSYQTTVLNHTAAGFATTCESCHTTTAWNPGTFNHTTGTTFPLTGGHLAVACSGCHSTVFKGLSTLCYSCHQTDYNGATNPPHQSAGFPTTCETCHSTTDWTSSTFNHNTSTTFPLTGAHVSVSCNGCHSSGVYKGLSTLCYSCHQTNYQTTVLNHTAAGFATTCENCHNTTAWNPGTFNHTTGTTFPLTGAHTTLLCSQCHSTVFKGLSTLCYSCHATDYQTTVVSHTAAGFGTTCETCHTTTAWSGGKYTAHDTQFPIYSGTHNGKWSACTDCHTNTSNYLVFACYGSCHPVAQIDKSHSGRNGYVVGAGDSNKCYSCHPKGSGG